MPEDCAHTSRSSALRGLWILCALTLLAASLGITIPSGRIRGQPAPTATPLGGGKGKMAFATNSDGNYEIYSIDADGSNLRRLTNNIKNDGGSGISWSPDGQFIAFTSDRSGHYTQIWVMNADGSNVRRLTTGYYEANPRWSPDGKRIVYYTLDGIYVIDADGKNRRRVAPPDLYPRNPQWAPDGKQIAYNSDRSGPGIYIVDADGQNHHPLTDKGHAIGFAWSPDGQQIVLSEIDSSVRGEFYIFSVVDIDGKKQETMPHVRRADSTNLSWSPDGKYIAFSTDGLIDVTPDKIVLVDVSNSKLIEIATLPVESAIDNLTWSPDSKYLAFIHSVLFGVTPGIYLIAVDDPDFKMRRLTPPEIRVFNFAWAP